MYIRPEEEGKVQPIELKKPVLGINNVSNETDIPEGSLREAINVNINKDGDVIRREGRTLVYSGTGIHSYFERYFVEDGSFKYLNLDYSANTLFFGLDKKRLLSYTKINTDLFFTNGEDNYKSDGTLLGIESPSGQPILSPTAGQLKSGTYQVAVCFTNSDTFELSGTKLAASITVEDNSGIVLVNIPQSINSFSCAIFISNVNGDTLYNQIVIDTGITNYTISKLSKKGKTLDTQYLSRLPAGQILRFHKDRTYIAEGSTLWFSESMRFGLCKISKNFFNFPERITVCEPVENGIFIVADKTYFLTGIDINKMSLITVNSDKGIEGTGVSVKGSYFGIDAENDIAYWFSDKGAILGLNDGKTKNLTENRLSVDLNGTGISDYRELAGIRQVVSRLNKKNSQGNFGASDYATGEIIRNGVLIN